MSVKHNHFGLCDDWFCFFAILYILYVFVCVYLYVGSLQFLSLNLVEFVVCDQKFFSELMKEASQVAGCFSSRVRHLLHLHVATGMQRYVLSLRHCFKDDRKAMVLEGWMLIEYALMNAIAIRKILKKYDKVCPQFIYIY